jgi:hypothetical protein
MPEALILEFTGVSEAEYAAGEADDGTFIVSEVWSSRADQDAFMTSRLGAALAAGGVTAYPRVRWVPLVAFHQPGA